MQHSTTPNKLRLGLCAGAALAVLALGSQVRAQTAGEGGFYIPQTSPAFGTVTSVTCGSGTITTTGNCNVVASSTDGNLPSFNGTSGALQDSGIAAVNVVTLGGTQTLTNKTLTGVALGTPISGVLTNTTGLPVTTGISGLGTGVATALAATPSGAGGLCLITSCNMATPVLGVASAASLALTGSSAPANGFYLPATNVVGIAENSIQYGQFYVCGSTYSCLNLTASNGSELSLGVGSIPQTNFTIITTSNGVVLNEANQPLSLTVGVNSSAIGGAVNLTAGNGGTSSSGFAGGAVNLTAGNGAGSGNNNGGNIVITPGTKVNSGTGGTIQLINLIADTGMTDANICENTTTHSLYFGSGTLGICLGTSSARFKHDIQRLDVGLPEIMELSPISYKLNEAQGGIGKTLYGFEAEQMNTALPALVGKDLDGAPLTADYLGVVPVLVKAVQEEQQEILQLRADLAKLERPTRQHSIHGTR